MTSQAGQIQATKLLKNSNITVVASGLSTASLNGAFFADLGETKSYVSLPQFAILDFGKINFFVQVSENRVVAADTSGDLSSKSQIAVMVKKFLSLPQSANVSAIGVNFAFEIVLDGPLVDFLQVIFFKTDSLKRFGNTPTALGFKIILPHEDSFLTLSVDPVWENSTAAMVTLNFHHANPSAQLIEGLVGLYGRYVAQVSGLVEKIFQS